MIEHLGWEQLHVHAHRQQTNAIMLYRIVVGIVSQLVEIQAASILVPADTHTRGHANKFIALYCSVNTYMYSFYLSSICLWNSLPAELVTAPSLFVFKARIGAAVP